MCRAFCITLPINVRAEESNDKEPVYYETEQGRFVNDIDNYLEQLNNGVIAPFDSTITSYESNIALFDISEPSQKCSNIFGHKWGDWGGWEEVSRLHYPSSPCIATIERWRFCTRTHCSAHQIETDVAWVECSH